MKLTFRNARMDKSGKHNDRNFNLDYAEHIDRDRLCLNRYWVYNGNNIDTFEEIEKLFYSEYFSQHLEIQIESNKKHRNNNRIKSIEEYYRSVRYRPEDQLLQIGNIREHVPAEKLWECALEYAERFDEKYGDHCKILDMALHLDEATPHVHIRRAWIAKDENDFYCVNQSKALEEMGIERPYPDRPTSKHNNAKITFTHNDRQLMLEICREKGIELEGFDRTPKKHLSTEQYKIKELMDMADMLEERTGVKCNSTEDISNTIKKVADVAVEAVKIYEQNPLILYDDKVEARKKKNTVATLEYYNRILKEYNEKVEDIEDIEQAAASIWAIKKLKIVMIFLEKNHLEERLKEFERHYNNKEMQAEKKHEKDDWETR